MSKDNPLRFDIYRLSTDSRVPHVCQIEQEVIYCSSALQKAINQSAITEPGRFLIHRLKDNLHDEEYQQFDVDFEPAPLKIQTRLQDKIPTGK